MKDEEVRVIGSITMKKRIAIVGIAAMAIAIGMGMTIERSRSRQAFHDRFTGAGRYAKTGRFSSTGSEEAIRMGALFEMRDRGFLHRGLTRKEVARLLGDPSVRFPEGGEYERWRYSLSGGGLGVDFANGCATKFVRWFEEDHPTQPEVW
jgi:hypothetical protein